MGSTGLMLITLCWQAFLVPQAEGRAAVTTNASTLLLRFARAELERYASLTIANDDNGAAAAGSNRLRLLLVDLSVEHPDSHAQVEHCARRNHRNMQPQEHVVHHCGNTSGADAHHFVLAGGDAAGTLYASYHFVENVLGVGFSIAGDRLPAQRSLRKILQRAESVSSLGTVVSPRFSLRGIQPFHDFREGPDWWGEDDYATIFANIVKMRANFIGLHSYNFNELVNWIGPATDVLANGSVTNATPGASFATSGGGTHFVGPNTAAFPTSSYFCGAAALFETDCFCGNAEVVYGDACPVARTSASASKAFDRAGVFQARIFGLAHSLAVTTATGVELPVTGSTYWPQNITVNEIYAGILQRLVNLQTPLDYFWLWTSESWEWGQVNVTNPKVAEALQEFAALLAANKKLGSPFKLATGGWTLGPLALDSYAKPDSGIAPAAGGNSSTIPQNGDRLYWDEQLGREYEALSTIDGHVGAFQPNSGFTQLSRKGWSIPWMEDDPGITSIQFWAGRVLEHAGKAAQYGVQGLFGIHWRTRALSPQFSALFKAGWNNSALFGPGDEKYAVAKFYDEWCAAEFGGNGGVPEEIVSAACEPFRYLDAQVCSGNCASLHDYPSSCGDPGISQVYGTVDCLRPVAWVRIQFTAHSLLLLPAAPHHRAARHVVHCCRAVYFCLRWLDRSSQTVASQHSGAHSARSSFLKLQGSTMGHIAHKPGATGQGSPVPDPAQCTTLKNDLYRWVGKFEQLRGKLQSCGADPGVLERHQYWSGQFSAMRRTAAVDCAWANWKNASATLRQMMSSAKQVQSQSIQSPVSEQLPPLSDELKETINSYATDYALPAYTLLIDAITTMLTALLESTTNAGEMGVIGDLMDSKLPAMLNHTERMLLHSALVLGSKNKIVALPELTRNYRGRPRLFAPTLRPFVDQWPLRIRAVLLSNETTSNASVEIHWRDLAPTMDGRRSGWNSTMMRQLRITPGAGGVFEGHIGRNGIAILEWSISSGKLNFPATAPQSGQSVILRQ